MDRNVNWTDSAKSTAQTNTGESFFPTSQIWLNEMQDTFGGTGVEIIELDSDHSHTSEEEAYENIQNMSHMWSYARDDRFQELEDSYAVNRQARLRRRLRNSVENDFHESQVNDSIYFNGEPETVTLNQNVNCFTILNKDSITRLDNSSESFEDVEVDEAGCGDASFRREWKGETRCGEVVTFNSDVDGEKRMIWIYSFKNRRLLSNNDFELVNIPSQSDSRSTSSPECIDQRNNTDKITCGGRVASPIPPPYIPRLDLSLAATLPNVSEVSEPKSSQTSERDRERNPIPQKPVNGWFLDNSEKAEAVIKQDNSTSIVNWMSLSPRERRRRSRHTAIEVHNMVQMQPVTEIGAYPEGKLSTIEPTVTTEVETNTKAPSQLNTPSTNKTKKDVESPVVGDRGDYSNRSAQRPRIKFDRSKPCLSAPSAITEPLEKLDTQNWIAEHSTKPYHQRQVLRKDNRGACSDVAKLSAADKLSARNMSLLLPSEWREYSLVAGSRLSIEMSLDQDSERSGRLGSILRRCASCFKCCKYRF